MDEKIEEKIDEVQDSVRELQEKCEAKLEKEFSSVNIIMLRDKCRGFAEELDTLKEKLEDDDVWKK